MLRLPVAAPANAEAGIGRGCSDHGGQVLVPDGGGTDQGFINAVYHDALGRSTNPGGALFCSQLLANGGSPVAVAQPVLNSSEDDLIRLRGYYQQFLRRDLAPHLPVE